MSALEYTPRVDLPSALGLRPMPSERPTPDARLVRCAQRGDMEAFEELYRRHAGRVFGLCLRLTGDRAEAEELAQESFVRAWNRLGSFRRRSAFGSWLHRLTTNVVLDHLRARGRFRERFVRGEDAAGPPAAARAERPGDRLDLEAAIAGLPPQARTVFVLHHVEGYKHREIAAMTGLAEGTSKAHLHRARKLLRKALDR